MVSGWQKPKQQQISNFIQLQLQLTEEVHTADLYWGGKQKHVCIKVIKATLFTGKPLKEFSKNISSQRSHLSQVASC